MLPPHLKKKMNAHSVPTSACALATATLAVAAANVAAQAAEPHSSNGRRPQRSTTHTAAGRDVEGAGQRCVCLCSGTLRLPKRQGLALVPTAVRQAQSRFSDLHQGCVYAYTHPRSPSMDLVHNNSTRHYVWAPPSPNNTPSSLAPPMSDVNRRANDSASLPDAPRPVLLPLFLLLLGPLVPACCRARMSLTSIGA